ncbi:MAG: hypothetical protein V5B39_12570 [Accumulibacter sp.]|jgi:hypothetical protein|uniref:hypothetical protein n=1 Tax=Accumulibacter sp. TaxID=2053492 RepID=UPI002FC3AE27
MTTHFKKKPHRGRTGRLQELHSMANREGYRITRRTFKGYPLVDVLVWFDDATPAKRRVFLWCGTP